MQQLKRQKSSNTNYLLQVNEKENFQIYVGFAAVRCKKTETTFDIFEHKKLWS